MRTPVVPHRDPSAGFTLLEALIAMALTGVIVGALAAITGQWLPNWNRGLGRVQQAERVALGLDRIVADLAAAEFIPKGRDTLNPLFDGRERSASFVRTTLSPNAPPSLEVVTIAQIRGQDGPVVVRMAKPFVPAAPGDREAELTPSSAPVVLFRSPYGLKLAYAGLDRIWRDTWQEAMLLPRAIKLTIHHSTREQTIFATTATLVHAELPARCVTAKSVSECLSARSERGSPQTDKLPDDKGRLQ
jgi:general secretion pathway protein J